MSLRRVIPVETVPLTVNIAADTHRKLKLLAVERRSTMRELTEQAICELVLDRNEEPVQNAR